VIIRRRNAPVPATRARQAAGSARAELDRARQGPGRQAQVREDAAPDHARPPAASQAQIAAAENARARHAEAKLQRGPRRPRPDGRAGRSWTTHRPNPPPALSGKHSAKQPPAQNIPFLASEDTHSRLGSAAHMSGYTRGLPEQTHCVAQGALEEK
jgi:hypothetical protein